MKTKKQIQPKIDRLEQKKKNFKEDWTDHKVVCPFCGQSKRCYIFEDHGKSVKIFCYGYCAPGWRKKGTFTVLEEKIKVPKLVKRKKIVRHH